MYIAGRKQKKRVDFDPLGTTADELELLLDIRLRLGVSIAGGPPLDGRDLQQEQHRCLEGAKGVANWIAAPATECQNCDSKNIDGNSK